VITAAASAITPISGAAWNNAIEVDGYQPATERDRLTFYNFVTPGYFRTLGTPLLAGRDIEASDTATSTPVAVVNEAFAAKFLGDSSEAPKRR